MKINEKNGFVGEIDMPRISVAMAVYNGEQYLEEQIESILTQLCEEDELVISYDLSTDNTINILEKYINNKLVKVVLDPGRGIFSNFENAIKNCSGDYIFISDQDDIWDGKKREKVLEDFRMYNVSMVIHNGVHIDSEGKVISKDFFSLYGIKNGIVKNFVKPRYSGCCTVFKRELKELLLPIPRNIGAYDHWIGMIGECFGKVFFDEDILLYHRLHGSNATVTRRNITTIFAVRYNLLKELYKCNKRLKAKYNRIRNIER